MRAQAIVTLVMLAASCANAPARPHTPVEDALAATPLIDGHNDLLIHYVSGDGKGFRSIDSYDVSRPTAGQVDLPRLRAGRVGGAIFTIAILDERDKDAGIKESTNVLRQLAAAHPNDLEVVVDASGLMRAVGAGRLAVMMGLEGGEQIGGSLEVLRALHRHGVRAMTLVWEQTNDLGDSSAGEPRHDGLSAFGREVVVLMNRLGMLIDLSHAAETTARDVLTLTKAPVIFSHSSARRLCPTPRNVSDELLREVAGNGGIVMVSFVPYFTTPEYRAWYDRGEARWAELKRVHGDDKAAVSAGMAAWDRDNPQPTVTIQDVADHVEHVRRVAGVDHVGLGSDFDGMGTFRVTGLDDASTFPALLTELASRGWSEQDIAKVAGGNFLRVLRTVQDVADDVSFD